MRSIEEIRAARPAHLDTPTDAKTRAQELNYAFSQPRQEAPRRRLRPVWGLGLAGAATAVAVAVAVSATQESPPSSPVTSPASPASITLDARTVLLAAASQAEAQPENTGNWWYSTSVQRSLLPVKGDPSYTVYEMSKSEMWTPFAPRGEQVGRRQSLGFAFPNPQDEAAWKQAGSPTTVVAEVGRKPGGIQLSKEPKDPEISRSPLVDGDKVFWLGKNVTMRDLMSLPDDPKRLKAWLLRSYGGHDTEAEGIPMSSEAWLYRVATGLIADMPVRPKVRGAAFRMLAELKTVSVVENVKDMEGRTGTAVTMKEKAGGTVLNRLLFDRETGHALQTDSVIIEPGGYQKGLPAGSLWNIVTITTSEWVDENP